jgi:hypothetical protein
LKTDEEKQIDENLRKELKLFKKKNGRSAGIKDKEFWESSEKYKGAHSVIIEERKKIEKKEEAEKRKELDNPVATGKPIVTERFCNTDGCDNIIQPTGKRGRPPTKCEKCRAK